MPASQLKRLKASLREQGITSQQKSKKQKVAHKSRPTSEKVERSAALQQIRDSFNPFELRQPARPAKFATANARPASNARAGRYKDVLHRPGVTKGVGEEMRRATLLPEMHRRNKIGGVIDRRIGEGDTDMTPEEKAAQRFVRAQSKKRGADLFNLEASDDEIMPGDNLTHGGRNINDLAADDFGEAMSDASNDDGELFTKKRRHAEGDLPTAADIASEQPDRKKSRKEVMEEVITKSKFHKYERQKAKEDDEDLREELDKGMDDVLALLEGRKPVVKHAAAQLPPTLAGEPHINPDRQKLLDGADRKRLDKDYDTRLRQLAQDTRAKPSERTKTEEEKIAGEAERLRLSEEKRLKRMQGEEMSDNDEEVEDRANGDTGHDTLDGVEDFADEAAAFGLQTGDHTIRRANKDDNVVHSDEDDFALDEDLVASDSDEGSALDDSEDESSDGSSANVSADDEEDEFVRGILGEAASTHAANTVDGNERKDGVAFTYPCPRSHAELLDVFKGVQAAELSTVIQRIRALHHPSLSASNKEAMGDFSAALVDHISYLASTKPSPLAAVEQVIRHVHSLSRTYPLEIANAFRKHLNESAKRAQPTAGDLVLLTAIGSIYPTSDHFHQVVTPATTLIAKYLGLGAPATLQSQVTGSYLVKLVLHYQRLSRRYMPEAVRFTYRVLSTADKSSAAANTAHLTNLVAMAELWRDKSAFTQVFSPFVPLLTTLSARKELQTLQILLGAARTRCRPLELHHHRPLAIRSSIPKFEEGFNPDKHYDPDKERSEANKLQKEYKRERKGALRELRKDANFMAREQLREKKERDAAYDKKYKRLVAEIQGEEGREAKEYEREKKARKRARR